MLRESNGVGGSISASWPMRSSKNRLVPRKVNRTPKAIRNMLKRNQLSLREIRCDLFSVESLASAPRVRKAEIVFWIEQEWLQASIACRGKRSSYTITPEALIGLFEGRNSGKMLVRVVSSTRPNT